MKPDAVYAELRSLRKEEIAQLGQRHAKLGYARLATVAGAGVIAWYALSGGFSILWILIPVAAFIALMAAHERLLVVLERRRRAERFFERGLARLRGDWAGHGESGERYLNPTHPYAPDLDIFGRASLFELLSTARTHIGEDTLAGWLQYPAPPETVLARQAAVDELRPGLDLRERLAVVAEEARTGVDPVALAHWGEAPAQLGGAGLRAAVWGFRIFGIAACAAGAATLAGVMGPRMNWAWYPKFSCCWKRKRFTRRCWRSCAPHSIRMGRRRRSGWRGYGGSATAWIRATTYSCG
jgi:hypothetical protein